jgi:hypothetical protein
VLPGQDHCTERRKGERQLLTKPEIDIQLDAKAWHVLTVEQKGDSIKVFVDKKKVFDGNDKTYAKAGQIGLWIKADSYTLSDDLMVEEFKE